VSRKPLQRNEGELDGRSPGENGQIAAFVVIMVTALILCAGLVIDGGLALATKIRATDEAQSASRAGAEQINLATYRATGTISLDPIEADAAAERYLAATGDRGHVAVVGDTVTVTVVANQPTQILGVAGLHSLTVTASASARAIRGISGPGQ
jgi:Flp pilus assembly protein TadG